MTDRKESKPIIDLVSNLKQGALEAGFVKTTDRPPVGRIADVNVDTSHE